MNLAGWQRHLRKIRVCTQFLLTFVPRSTHGVPNFSHGVPNFWGVKLTEYQMTRKRYRFIRFATQRLSLQLFGKFATIARITATVRLISYRVLDLPKVRGEKRG